MSPEARAARERKQKIFVAVGGLLLLALLALQLPKLLGGSESAATPALTTTAVDGTTTTVAGEVVPSPDAAVPVSVTLVDTDRRLHPGPGQLGSFETFSRKDPFVQQIKEPAAETAEGTGAAKGGGAPGDGKTPETPSTGFTVGGSTAAVAVTVISVNGTRQVLEPGMTFPAADPVFVLVAEQPDKKTAVIGVAGGAYANGNATTKLKVGKPVLLVNTTTGARYRVVLVAVGNGGATSPAGPGSSPAPTPTP